MGLGTNQVTTTTAATFIPEIWSDEIIAGYKKNLVLANLINKMNHSGKKGDTIHIPKPTRGSASAKAANTEVTLIAATEGEVQVAINKHFEYSRLIEDIVDVQAQPSLRSFYTEDAGYALATQLDSDIGLLAKTFGDDNGSGSDVQTKLTNNIQNEVLEFETAIDQHILNRGAIAANPTIYIGLGIFRIIIVFDFEHFNSFFVWSNWFGRQNLILRL